MLGWISIADGAKIRAVCVVRRDMACDSSQAVEDFLVSALHSMPE